MPGFHSWAPCRRSHRPARGYAQHVEIEHLDLFARPRRAAQELEARCDARFVIEAADVDPPSERRPAEACHQFVQDLLQREAVQRIVGL